MMAHKNFDQRTQDVRISQDVIFETMLLEEKTLDGLKRSGFFKPSPIQLHGIPLGKCGFDLLLEAKSGTGKTAVFSVVTLEKLDLQKGLQTVILAPTREIASQICDVIKLIGSQYEGLTTEVVMGGLPVHEDITKFKKQVHVVVGSPGRLKHLIQDKHIDTSAVRLLVLDEADKLMEKGFMKDINYIFNALPKQKQVIMSSATYPEECKLIINKFVQNVQHICPDSTSILLGIEQRFTVVKYNINIVRQTQYRFEELLKILSNKPFKQCIIFCNYQARVSELFQLLSREKWPAEQLHGQQEQTDRLDTLKTLQDYKCRILIATDLASRGIDASNVDLIINFEPPYEWQIFLHRIGRAGRFGSFGQAITILSEGKEFTKFKEIMSSMNINLIKLWTDGNCDSTDSNNDSNTETSVCLPLKVDTVFKKSYDTLWSSLTKRDDGSKITESFEKICESFNEHISNPAVESFSDLVDSFSDSKDMPPSKLSYKHMKVSATPEIKEYLDDLKDVKNEESYFNTLIQSQKAGNSIVNNDLGERKECTYAAHLKLDIRKSLDNNHQRQHFVNTHNHDKKLKKKSWNDKYLCDDNEELLQAGLPAAFSSHKQKNTSKYYDEHPENRFSSPSTDFIGQTKKSSQVKRRNANLNVDDYISEEDNKMYDSYCERLRNKINQNKYRNYTSDENDDVKNKFSHNKNVGTSNNSEWPRNYNAWYNQLQFRVKQLEMMIYINEMAQFKYYD